MHSIPNRPITPTEFINAGPAAQQLLTRVSVDQYISTLLFQVGIMSGRAPSSIIIRYFDSPSGLMEDVHHAEYNSRGLLERLYSEKNAKSGFKCEYGPDLNLSKCSWLVVPEVDIYSFELLQYDAQNRIISIVHDKPDENNVQLRNFETIVKFTYEENNPLPATQFGQQKHKRLNYSLNADGFIESINYYDTNSESKISGQHFIYDANAQLIEVGQSEGEGSNVETQWTMKYDEAGRLLHQENFASRQTCEYDIDDKLTKIITLDSFQSEVTMEIEFKY